MAENAHRIQTNTGRFWGLWTKLHRQIWRYFGVIKCLSVQREQMVRKIEGRGIRSHDVLRVMRATPRHLFLPPDLMS